MSSRLQTLWPKEALVARAAKWSRRRGWPSPTVASFLKWKQEHLLPRPIVRSLGRGRGSRSGWSSKSYCQLLRILAYRQAGFRRWRDLRIALWLDGYDVDIRQIRLDLEDLFQSLVKSMNADMHTELWGATSSSSPTPAASRVIRRRVTAPEILGSFVDKAQLDPEVEPFVRLGLSAFVSPEGQRFAVAFVHQFFAQGAGDIPAAMEALRATLPGPIAVVLDGAESDWTAHSGLLAHPDAFENPLLRGIKKVSDETLLNLRGVANLSNTAWSTGCRLGVTALNVRPDLLGNFRLLAPVLQRLLVRMASRPLFRSPSARVVLIAMALASDSVRSNQGRKLMDAMRLIDEIGGWLVRHPDVIRDFERLSNERWHDLMSAPDFPSFSREFILAAEESGASTGV